MTSFPLGSRVTAPFQDPPRVAGTENENVRLHMPGIILFLRPHDVIKLAE